MVQLKKKAVLLIGALMLLLGMGMNLQYALNDYGLAENKAVNQVLAQITGSTETGNPPGEGWTGMYMNCYNQVMEINDSKIVLFMSTRNEA